MTTSIVWFDFGNIGTAQLCVALISDGSLVQINIGSGVATQMAPAGTIHNPAVGQIAMTQWGSQLLILIANQTDGYFIWNGTTFFTAGMTAPDGNPVPHGIQGTAIETYANRVWTYHGAVRTFSAPGSYTDFATNDGGGSAPSTDSFLRVGYTNAKQSNGFLYEVADSSIGYISGVNVTVTGGSIATTTFTNQNADPEIGSPWAAAVEVYSRNILLANPFGIHISYGGAVKKLSNALDGIFNSRGSFGSFVPSTAKAIIFGRKVAMTLIPIIDQVTGQPVNKLMMWDGDAQRPEGEGPKWFTSSQDVPLLYIATQEFNSQITAYGTDGTAIYPLFQTPSVGFKKTMQSKLFAEPGSYHITKDATRLWGLVNYYSTLAPDLTVSIDNENGAAVQNVTVGLGRATVFNNSDAIVTIFNNSGAMVPIIVLGQGIAVFPPTAVAQTGVLTGITLSTNAADMAVVSLLLQDVIQGYRG